MVLLIKTLIIKDLFQLKVLLLVSLTFHLIFVFTYIIFQTHLHTGIFPTLFSFREIKFETNLLENLFSDNLVIGHLCSSLPVFPRKCPQICSLCFSTNLFSLKFNKKISLHCICMFKLYSKFDKSKLTAVLNC